MPDTPEQRLAALGITLPPAPRPVAAYVPFVRTGNLVFVSGQVPFKDGSLLAVGRVPDQVDVETAIACARQCALNGLAIARDAAGSLDEVRRVVRLGVFVSAQAGFHEEPKIGNGASQLMLDVFGDAGRHARAAVGVSDLPLGAPVEVDFVFEVA
ncbi:MAG: RidA family protein [Phycisphaerales bacterium]|nr:RidA family protein [Phycisphaerales bacterium]MCB9840889.1 RidA family protein [Phycisphaeraceae bacterium]